MPDGWQRSRIVRGSNAKGNEANSESLPIPRVVEIGTDEELNGGVFAVSQRMSGQHLDALSPARLAATLPSLFATLASVGAHICQEQASGYGTRPTERHHTRHGASFCCPSTHATKYDSAAGVPR